MGFPWCLTLIFEVKWSEISVFTKNTNSIFFLSFSFFMCKWMNSHSAGSSSNISSSNSNNSDNGFNSLDSMENDTIHQNKGRHKNRMPALMTTSNSIATTMSYLGPFNFRQLLRPVHERNVRNVPSQKIWLHLAKLLPNLSTTTSTSFCHIPCDEVINFGWMFRLLMIPYTYNAQQFAQFT